MRIVSLLCLLTGLSPGAQVIMAGSASRGDFRFRYETRVEPELPGKHLTGFGGGFIAGQTIHRYLTDRTARRYFGYDVSIDPQPGDAFRVAILPLSISAQKLELTNDWRGIPLPPLPPPQVVRAGETIALDLFVHPGTGQKVVDYLFIQDNRDVGFRLPTGPPRDFIVEDVPITLHKLRLAVNGKQVEEWGGSMSGGLMSFYLPGHGQFRFSLAPNEQQGFTKAGEVRGDTLTIKWGNDTYVFACDGPVAPGGGVFNLYVKHDPMWRPKGPDEFHLAASDR